MSSLPLTDLDLSIEEHFYNYSTVKITSESDLIYQIQNLTENISSTLSLDRVGVWILDDNKKYAFCKNLFDKTNLTHSHNISIPVSTFPSYFSLLCQNKIICCSQVKNTPAIRDFWQRYLREREIQSMINSTIWIDGSLAGIVTGATVARSKNFTGKDKFIFNSAADTITNWIYQITRLRELEVDSKATFLKKIFDKFAAICSPTSQLKLEEAISEILVTLKESTNASKVKAVFFDDIEAKGYTTENTFTKKISNQEIKEIVSSFGAKTYFWFSECSQPNQKVTAPLLKLIEGHVGPGLIVPINSQKNNLHQSPAGLICYYFKGPKSPLVRDLLEIASDTFKCLTFISDYYKTKALFSYSLEISQTTFENSFNGIVLLDENGEIIKLNDAAKEIFNLSQESIGTFSVLETFRDNELTLKIKNLLRKPNYRTFKIETSILSKSEIKKSVVLSLAKITTKDGSKNYNMLQFLDITKRNEAIRELAKEKNFFCSVIDSSPNFVFAKDRHGKFVLANKAIADAYGTTKENIIGKTDADFNDSASQVEHFINDDLKVINSGAEIHIIDEEVTDSMGNIRVLETTKKPLYCEDINDNISLGISVDVTSRKNAESEYREWLRKLEQSQRLESLGLLASSIAHDFNNILQGVIGNISLASDLLIGNSKAKNLIQLAQNSAEKAAEITTQLLSYGGENDYQKKLIDLTETAREAFKLVERLSSQKAEIRFDVSLKPLLILADIRKLRQVIINLITNAIDSFQSKQGIIQIRTYPAARNELLSLKFDLFNELNSDSYAVFDIEDNGGGIPSQVLERIFEPFFSTKESGKGIGLAACLGIIKQHDGFIGVKSVVGSGTSFLIGLPLQDTEYLLSPGILSVDTSDTKGLKKGSTFLVIEDEAVSSEVCVSMLEYLQFNPQTAFNGETGIQKFMGLKDNISCIILDVSLPDQDGVEVYSTIRKQDTKLPILLTSGYSLNQIKIDLQNDEHATFLQKPYTVDQLQNSLKLIWETE